MRALAKLIRDYEWIHLTLGLTGNLLFVVGSIGFLFEPLKTGAIWLFIVGSSLMLVGAAGNAIVKLVKLEGNGVLGDAARRAV